MTSWDRHIAVAPVVGGGTSTVPVLNAHYGRNAFIRLGKMPLGSKGEYSVKLTDTRKPVAGISPAQASQLCGHGVIAHASQEGEWSSDPVSRASSNPACGIDKRETTGLVLQLQSGVSVAATALGVKIPNVGHFGTSGNLNAHALRGSQVGVPGRAAFDK